jgi:hypothetical protein
MDCGLNSLDFGQPDFIKGIALCRRVRQVDMIEVDELEMASANGGKLNRNVPAHGTDANHGDATIL